MTSVELFGNTAKANRLQFYAEDVFQLFRNNNKFGNGCCVFTSSGEKARSFSENVEIGMVGVNIPLPVPSSFHSFGGWKNSLWRKKTCGF